MGFGNSVGPVIYSQEVEKFPELSFERGGADGQAEGQLLRGYPLSHQLEYLLLAR